MPFTFTLKHKDGSPAEPPTFATAVPNWSTGDTIPLAVTGRCAWPQSKSLSASPSWVDSAGSSSATSSASSALGS